MKNNDHPNHHEDIEDALPLINNRLREPAKKIDEQPRMMAPVIVPRRIPIDGNSAYWWLFDVYKTVLYCEGNSVDKIKAAT